ncbi:MAG: hypothetical protein KAH31_11010 [Candidatus Sabulitectum sp.]|nr:hypothetical protein [Candidatus Sabulitectum sp.]
MSVVQDLDCLVTHIEQVLPGVVRIVFDCPGISSVAAPGQFVQIESSSDVFPVTRRPITINLLTDSGFELLFDVIGRGTELLARMQPGDTARVLGPLGNGWMINPASNCLLIGGGLGAAGFQFLIDSVHSAEVLIGASGQERVIPFGACHVVTEDGSVGEKGLVTSLLSEEFFAEADVIAVCGPVAMMEAVWSIIPEKHQGKVQISTESRMGCGWGVCDGCSIPMLQGGYRKCCTEGPVFHGTEIDWKRWKEAGL